MTAEPAPTTGLVATLDLSRKLALDKIPADGISRLVTRIVSSDRKETTIDIAAFGSSI